MQKKYSRQKIYWNQWFAGLVDADGCLLLNTQGYTCLEITMSSNDEYALQQIKKQFGGSIKLRSKSKAYRYRLHNKLGMINVLQSLNGYCYNSIRLRQLKKLMSHYHLDLIQPYSLNQHNAWFAGFFDGDGTLSYCFKKGWPQLIISVSNKKLIDCEPFQKQFGGSVRLDKRCNTYKWEISKKTEIMFFHDYLNKYPLKSIKKKRVQLIPTFFQLRALQAYNKPSTSLMHKSWVFFEKQWFQFVSF